MPDYQKLYVLLFNSVTESLRALDNGFYEKAQEILTNAQQNVEEIYISSDQ